MPRQSSPHPYVIAVLLPDSPIAPDIWSQWVARQHGIEHETSVQRLATGADAQGRPWRAHGFARAEYLRGLELDEIVLCYPRLSNELIATARTYLR